MKQPLPKYAEELIEASERQLRLRSDPKGRQPIKNLIRDLLNATHVVVPDNGEIYRKNFGSDKNFDDSELVSLAGGAPADITAVHLRFITFENRYRTDIFTKVVVLVHKYFDGEMNIQGFREFTDGWNPLQFSAVIKPGNFSVDRDGGKVVEYLLYDNHKEDYVSHEAHEMHAQLQDFFINVFTQLCHSLRAGAVFSKPEKIHSKKRLRRFKKQGYKGIDYHELKIPGSNGNESICGTTHGHASPRLHLRRAHIRHLPTGKITFVKQCFVGDPELGFVGKSYDVDKPKDRADA